MTVPAEIVAALLAEHRRGDWSDGTYSCHGCARRVESASEASFAALGREPTREELAAAHKRYNAATHPGWTFADYNAHVAEALVELFQGGRNA